MHRVLIFVYLLVSCRATICYMYTNVFRVNKRTVSWKSALRMPFSCPCVWFLLGCIASAKIQPTLAYNQLTFFCITVIFINIAISWAPHKA